MDSNEARLITEFIELILSGDDRIITIIQNLSLLDNCNDPKEILRHHSSINTEVFRFTINRISTVLEISDSEIIGSLRDSVIQSWAVVNAQITTTEVNGIHL